MERKTAGNNYLNIKYHRLVVNVSPDEDSLSCNLVDDRKSLQKDFNRPFQSGQLIIKGVSLISTVGLAHLTEQIQG